MKNEHLIWAAGTREGEQGSVLIIGIAEPGLQTLKGKKTLTFELPKSIITDRISNVVIFHEPTKAELKRVMRESGLPIIETDLGKL